MFKFHSGDVVYRNSKWVDECLNNPGGSAGVIYRSMIVNPLEAELNFERARMFAKTHTNTGYRIMNAVRSAKTKIHVIAWRSTIPGAPGFCMFSNDSPVPGQGTIYVNLDAIVTVTAPNQEDSNKRNVYNNFVVIFHEVGHALQFIESPAWFRLNEGTKAYTAGAEAEVGAAYMRLTRKKAGGLRAAEAILGMPEKSFSSAIEWDNYIYHEGPICDELGLARRIRYLNTTVGFGDTNIGGGVRMSGVRWPESQR